MNQLNLNEVYEYAEKHISAFHQKRLEYATTTTELDKILQQKNPYLFPYTTLFRSQDLIKGFLDAFLQSQEETLFGEFIESLAIFVCDKVFSAKKSQLTGIDLEFEKNNCIYNVRIKAGWNWGNASQIKQLKINFENARKILENHTNKKVIAVNGCCFGNKKNKNPEKDGYYKICGQEFWQLVSGSESFYIDIIEPIGHKAKQKNEEFLEAYSVVVNKFTLEFAQRFCIDGKFDWEKLLEFNSGTKKKHK